MNQTQHNPTTATPICELTVLSHEEQRRIVLGSYQHQYGFFIRLAMFTGISSDELLRLNWDDVDEYGSRIRIGCLTNTTGTKSNRVQWASFDEIS